MPTPDDVLQLLRTLLDDPDTVAIHAVANVDEGHGQPLESPELFAACPHDVLDVFGNGLLQLARRGWEVLPIVLDGMNTDDRYTREKALNVLESLLDDPSPALQQNILDLLRCDRGEVCRKIVDFASRHDPSGLAVLPLLSRLTDASLAGRQAIESLLASRPIPAPTVVSAMGFARNASPEVRRLTTVMAGNAAAAGIEPPHDGEITRVLLDCSDDESPLVRSAAARALDQVIAAQCGFFGNAASAAERLQNLLQSRYAEIRTVALRHAPLPAFLDALITTGLRDPNFEVRSEARARISGLPAEDILKLWKLTGLGPQLALALASGLETSPPPNDLAAMVIDSVPPEDWPLVYQHLLWHPQPLAREAALQFLEATKKSIDRHHLVSQAIGVHMTRRDPADSPFRITATRVLGMAGDAAKPAIHTLVDAALDEEGHVQVEACEALCKIGEVPPPDRGRIVSILLAMARNDTTPLRNVHAKDIATIWQITDHARRLTSRLTTALLRTFSLRPGSWGFCDPVEPHLLASLVDTHFATADFDADRMDFVELGRLLFSAWGLTRRGALAASVFERWGPTILTMPQQGPHWAVHIHNLRRVVRQHLTSRDMRYLRRWLGHHHPLMRLAAVDWLGELPPEPDPRESIQEILRVLAEAQPDDRYVWHATLKTFARWGQACRAAMPKLEQLARQGPHATEWLSKLAILHDILTSRTEDSFDAAAAAQGAFAAHWNRRARVRESFETWITRAFDEQHALAFPFQAVHLVAWERQATRALKRLTKLRSRRGVTHAEVDNLIERLTQQLRVAEDRLRY